MAFAGSDNPIAELVWSPQNGLSLQRLIVQEVNTPSKEKPDSKVSAAFVGTAQVNTNHPNTPLPISSLPLRREKGKETALSDESAESCNNSIGLFSKCIVKRQRNDDGLGLMMHGSKRMKRKTRMDISFMRCISNMVKGLPERSVKEDSSSLALSKVSNSGFQSVFQSLNCRNMDISNNEVRNDHDSSEECRKDHEIIGKNDNSCKPIVVVSEKDVRKPTTNVGQSSTPWIFSSYKNEAFHRAKDGVIPSNTLGKQVNSSEENVKNSRSFPLFNTAAAKYKVVPSGVFRAIRNSRLSRSEVLRWMNSKNLNGYFVRLRLGKMEGGIWATHYYIARITGDAREQNCSRSTKSILVDVGGMKSSVESRYVSNHEFLEDEIKAWWCRTVENGCKIPSLEELNAKANDRKSLRF